MKIKNIYNYGKWSLILLFITITTELFSQTDNCGAGATLLTPNSTCSYSSGNSSSGFTDSNQGCIIGDEDDDVWYPCQWDKHGYYASKPSALDIINVK